MYNYLPYYYIEETFSSQIRDLLSAMKALDRLLLVSDNAAYAACRQELSEQFERITRDAPVKNGVRIISKYIKYYANGLIESCSNSNEMSSLIGKPFAHKTEKVLEPAAMMETDIFKNTNVPCNKLFRTYLMSKISGKNSSAKLPKLSKLMESISDFKNTIDRYDMSVLNTEHDKFTGKMIHAYYDLRRSYIDMLMFVSFNGLSESPSGHIPSSMSSTSAIYYAIQPVDGEWYMFMNNYRAWISDILSEKIPDMYVDMDGHKPHEYLHRENWQSEKSFEYRVTLRGDENICKMTYLSEQDVTGLVNVMKRTFAEMFPVYEKSKEYQSVYDVIEKTNESVVENGLSYYETHILTAESSRYEKDADYQKLGMVRMICRTENNTLVSTVSVNRLDTIDAMSFPHSMRCDADNSAYDAMSDKMKSEIINRRQIIKQILSESCNTMTDNIKDIIHSLNNVNNDDYRNWLISKSVIPKTERK